MAHFLPAQIDCLDNQVDAYASAHAEAMHCFDVEELMSLFVSLAIELEKSCSKAPISDVIRHEAATEFGHLVKVGARIREMIVRLRDAGYTVSGIDAFMRTLLRCRVGANSEAIAAEGERLRDGKIKTRAIEELIDELQRRDNPAGG